MSSPLQRSKKHMEDQGFVCEIVERGINTPNGFIRKDFLGIGDLLCMRLRGRRRDWVLVQATSHTNHSAHYTKLVEAEKTSFWLTMGKLLLQSWGLKGKRGERKTHQIREQEITFADVTN